MSNTYSNLTVVAAADMPTSRIECLDDVTRFFDPSTSVYMLCHSCNWLAVSLGKVARAYEMPELSYLDDHADDVTVLDQARIDVVVPAIERVLERMADNPGFYVDLTGRVCTEEEVTKVLRGAPHLPEPQHDVDNDFGHEEPLCTISFFKLHVEVLKIARRRGCHAIHARSS